MRPITSLICFGIRQVLGVNVEDVAGDVERHFTDQSLTLPRALANANDKAWRALGIALAGDGLFNKITIWATASGDEKGFREQVGRFLTGKGISFEGSPENFRKACLGDLNKALKAKLLSAENLSPKDIARQTADFRRYADAHGLLKGAEDAVAQVAKALEPECPNLAHLLGQPAPGGPPLLVAAFSYFFRREVEKDDELANGLFFDNLKQLSAAQAKSFQEVSQTLDGLGQRLDQAFDEISEELERTRRAAEEAEKAAKEAKNAAEKTHGGILNLQAELKGLDQKQLANMEEVRQLFRDAMTGLERAGMKSTELRAQYSFSIRGDDERQAVKQLLARLRQLPEADRRQVPALINGVGELQVGAGDFAGARQTFADAAQVVADPAGKAEAFYNVHRAALEERRWDEALTALRQAASLEPKRFAPFLFQRYEPKRILGAGGFGTAVLCHDHNFAEDVVVKTLHGNDLARGLDDVFREARTLRMLSHPAIIGVQDCAYADADKKARPYLVMNYFAGESLEQFVQQRGPLSPDQLVAVARQIAEGMKAAHDCGILHRDLKPDNILVRKEGETWHVKIIDFGLAVRPEPSVTGEASSAKSIIGQSLVGTMRYAPPEQRGEMPGIRPGTYSDVYAFGKLCCFALFRTTQPLWNNWQSLPPPLTELLNNCLQEDLGHRYKNFEPVLEALRRCDPCKPSEPPNAKAEPSNLPIKIPCPQCRTILKLSATITPGIKVRCPKCSTVFTPGSPSISEPNRGAAFEKELEEALAEMRTKGNATTYFAQHAADRIGVWETAAHQGNAVAQWFLSWCLYDGAGVQKDSEASVSWLRRAAESGLAIAQNDLGTCYYWGDGEEADLSEAFRLYTIAADQGLMEAEINLGDCYYEGEGVEQDHDEAARHYRKAAEAGWARGQYELGGCYFNGSGVEQDYPQAIGWIRKAAEQGLADAQHNLGYCYATGKGVKKNWDEAAKGYRKAAEQGIDEAQFALGDCYERGRGVEEDIAQAEQWYRKAADQGHRRAKNALARLREDDEPDDESEPDEKEEFTPISDFYKDLCDQRGEAEKDVAEKIVQWAEWEGLEQNCYEGKTLCSFIPMLSHREENLFPISVQTSGRAVVQVQYLKSRWPFNARQKQLELLTKLNEIPGVAITEDRISGRPSIPLSLLIDQTSLDRFLTVLSWIVAEIRADTDTPENPIPDPDEVASFYVLNTNFSNDPVDHEDMLQKKKAAAFFDPWKFKIENLSKGDTVFLYQSGVGLVALGQASGKLEKAAYHGDQTKQDEEYFMALEQFQRIEPPLSAAKIKEITGKNHVFLQTIFSLDPDSASALIWFIQHPQAR